jgi:hypothetical protein
MSDTQKSASTDSFLALVGSSVTVVTGVLGTVGITAGIITVLLRNSSVVSFTRCCWLLRVWSRGFVAAVSRSSSIRRRGLAGGVSVVLVILGIGDFVRLTADALRTVERPTIAASISPGTSSGTANLEVTVSANGMKMDERYFIRVETLNYSQQGTPGREVFFTYAGPGADGKLEYKTRLLVAYDPSYSWVVWSPVDRDRTCTYARRVVAVKVEYSLTVDHRERDALAEDLAGCH